jgi:hypothetical protein
MLFVTFYTPDYERPAQRLVQSCEKAGVQIEATPYAKSGRTWRQIVQRKPRFIYERLIARRFDQREIVWIDADSIVQKRPLPLEGLQADVAMRFWCNDESVIEPDRPKDIGPDVSKFEPMCGVIYLKNTRAVRAFARRWMTISEGFKPTTTRPDQKALRSALQECKNIHCEALPMSCCFMRRFWPHKSHPLCKEAYIAASRWPCKDVAECEKIAIIENEQREKGTWVREDWEW